MAGSRERPGRTRSPYFTWPARPVRWRPPRGDPEKQPADRVRGRRLATSAPTGRRAHHGEGHGSDRGERGRRLGQASNQTARSGAGTTPPGSARPARPAPRPARPATGGPGPARRRGSPPWSSPHPSLRVRVAVPGVRDGPQQTSLRPGNVTVRRPRRRKAGQRGRGGEGHAQADQEALGPAVDGVADVADLVGALAPGVVDAPVLGAAASVRLSWS